MFVFLDSSEAHECTVSQKADRFNVAAVGTVFTVP